MKSKLKTKSYKNGHSVEMFEWLSDAAYITTRDGHQIYIDQSTDDLIIDVTDLDAIIGMLLDLDEYKKKQIALMLLADTLNPIARDEALAYVCGEPT